MNSSILIIGGGFIGSLMALALGNLGISTRILEQSSSLKKSKGGRAISITYASQKFLESLGLWKALKSHAQPLLEIHTLNGPRQKLVLTQEDSGNLPFGHMIEEHFLRDVLEKAVQNCLFIEWQEDVSIQEITQTQDFVEVILSKRTSLQASLVIGADGRHSAVRELMQFPKIDWDYKQWGIVCTYSHSNPHNGIAYEKFLPTGPFAILPLTENRSSIVWTAAEPLAEKLRQLSDAEFDQEVASHMKEFQNLHRLTERQMYPLSAQWVPKFTKPRVALVGDAAHVIHPLAGQGLNLGIQDVAILTETLYRGFSLGLDLGNWGLLNQYEGARRFDHLKLLGITHGLNQLFSNESQILDGLRDRGLQWVQNSSSLRYFFAHQGMGKKEDSLQNLCYT